MGTYHVGQDGILEIVHLELGRIKGIFDRVPERGLGQLPSHHHKQLLLRNEEGEATPAKKAQQVKTATDRCMAVDPVIAQMTRIGERKTKALDRELASFQEIDTTSTELGQCS
jgi:hypothetical protein